MAVADDALVYSPPLTFSQTAAGRNFFMALGIAAVLAVMAGVWMWSQQPEYRVLFANYSDRDGGAIVASLQQLNVPYKFAEGGNAILVPANQVHDARLKLAAQGLPKGGNVGFELMENQKLGVSQFLEQINFQRALEGELARSIESLASVETARVHLALPKASVFAREQQKPTASILINLRAGKALDQQQVSAIVHLVASSVPELPPGNVTLVDQSGNLLSDTSKASGLRGLDPSQLKYVQQVQQNIVRQVESILSPIVGPNNVRAEATADVDFSQSEQAAESYKPNQPPESAAVRSQQTSESLNGGGNPASGVPGALSNQPPAPATAPLTAVAGSTSTTAPASATTTHKDATVNYEVDKTIRYVQQPMGGVKRLSVAVVVNYKRIVDKTNKVTIKPLTDAEKIQITDLVKEAMGYNKDRGDTLNVLNSPFDGVDKPVDVIPEPPIWKQQGTWELVKEMGKYLIAAVVIAYLFFKLLKPLMSPLMRRIDAIAKEPAPLPALEHEANEVETDNPADFVITPGSQNSSYQQKLEGAKQLAKDDPRVVANVIKSWVAKNE